MRRLLFSMTIALVSSTILPAAADILPLQRGFYVSKDTPCEEASNATISLYDGASLGQAHAECRKWSSRTLSDGSYRVTRSCRDLEGRGGPWRIITSVQKILSHTEFVETNEYGDFDYRYCKQSELGQNWRDVDLSKIGAE